jgi:hypothetical protein
MSETKQINLKISKELLEAATRYADHYGYRNVQELAAESMRNKIFDDNEYDESFSGKEIDLIDELLSTIIEKKDFGTEEDLRKILGDEV